MCFSFEGFILSFEKTEFQIRHDGPSYFLLISVFICHPDSAKPVSRRVIKFHVKYKWPLCLKSIYAIVFVFFYIVISLYFFVSFYREHNIVVKIAAISAEMLL